MADADPQPGRVGEALQLVTPQAGAGIVGPAGIGGDRQRLRVRVALRAELLPPVNDRANRELGGVARDPDAHPSLVCGQVVNAVGDRVPESLVLEVVAANLDRATLRLKLAADRLEIADQLTLLRVHADHRLASRKRLADGLGDVLELSVAVGMLRTLPRLLVRLQAVPLGLQQPEHRPLHDIVTHLPQRFGELRAALRRPPQRRLRIAPGHRINEPLEILRQPRLALEDRRAPRMPAHIPRRGPLLRVQVSQTAQHR